RPPRRDTHSFPTRRSSDLSKRRLWVRKDIGQIVKREFYDKKGRLEKVQTDRRLVNVKGALWRADEIEMHDVQSDGRTILTVDRRDRKSTRLNSSHLGISYA